MTTDLTTTFKQRVYVETTVPSFYHSYRPEAQMVARREWTCEWWDYYSDRYELATSLYVLNELSEGSYPDQDKCVQMAAELPLLAYDPEIARIAEIYKERFVMPARAGLDALHLAMASFHKCDILLTWNCVHLANANKFRHIRSVNQELDLTVPLITTPYNLLEEKTS